MITLLEGNVVFKTDKFLVVNAGGVGFKVFLGLETIKSLPQKSEKIKLWTHLYMRENGLELYGFLGYAELEFFEILIQISGIGPKSALGVLGVAPLDTLKKAISSGEISYLTKVSGIGKKTAERIIVELRDKMGQLDESAGNAFKDEQDVLEALKSLGYSPAEAREAIKKIPDNITGVNARIKEALKILGK